MKYCRSCKIEKEDNEFYKRPINSDGLYSYCKLCCSVKCKITHQKFKEKRKEKATVYRENNRRILLEKAKRYYWDNREKVLEKSCNYRKEKRGVISFREALRRLKDENRFEKNRQRHLKWSEKHRDRLSEYQRIWYQNNKEKRRANVILNRAVKAGEIMRPNICSQCKTSCKPDGHHIDYTKPLDVIWICRKCHSRESPRTVIKCSF